MMRSLPLCFQPILWSACHVRWSTRGSRPAIATTTTASRTRMARFQPSRTRSTRSSGSWPLAKAPFSALFSLLSPCLDSGPWHRIDTDGYSNLEPVCWHTRRRRTGAAPQTTQRKDAEIAALKKEVILSPSVPLMTAADIPVCQSTRRPSL